MKAKLIIELVQLAISLADTYLDGGDVAHILLGMVQKGVQAYEEQTGQTLNPALIRAESTL